jgi:hypothetical protein
LHPPQGTPFVWHRLGKMRLELFKISPHKEK